MLDSLKRTILSALKTVALTSDDIRSVLDAFVSRGDLSEDLARKIHEALIERGGDGEEARDRAGKDFGRLSDYIPLVSRSEFRELAERVKALEGRLGPPAAAPEEVPPGSEAVG